MASMQVEGANTGSSANDDELGSSRGQLRAKNLYSILDMCSEYTRTNLGEEWTLQTLVGMRKNDVLELIDAINADESVSKNVGILQKVAFANMIQKYADQQNVAPPDHGSTNTDPSKHVCDYMMCVYYYVVGEMPHINNVTAVHGQRRT